MPAARFSFGVLCSLSLSAAVAPIRQGPEANLPPDSQHIVNRGMASTGLQFHWKPSAHENNTVGVGRNHQKPAASYLCFLVLIIRRLIVVSRGLR